MMPAHTSDVLGPLFEYLILKRSDQGRKDKLKDVKPGSPEWDHLHKKAGEEDAQNLKRIAMNLPFLDDWMSDKDFCLRLVQKAWGTFGVEEMIESPSQILRKKEIANAVVGHFLANQGALYTKETLKAVLVKDIKTPKLYLEGISCIAGGLRSVRDFGVPDFEELNQLLPGGPHRNSPERIVGAAGVQLGIYWTLGTPLMITAVCAAVFSLLNAALGDKVTSSGSAYHNLFKRVPIDSLTKFLSSAVVGILALWQTGDVVTSMSVFCWSLALSALTEMGRNVASYGLDKFDGPDPRLSWTKALAQLCLNSLLEVAKFGLLDQLKTTGPRSSVPQVCGTSNHSAIAEICKDPNPEQAARNALLFIHPDKLGRPLTLEEKSLLLELQALRDDLKKK